MLRARLLRRLWALPCSVALGTALGCSSGQSSSEGPSQANPLDSEEGTLVFDVNDYRAQAGLAALKVCASINVAASGHADDMRDAGYLGDTGSDGSTARSRACAAGYGAACAGQSTVAELVASGELKGDQVLADLAKDPTTEPILRNASLTVVGVGRSLGGSVPYWSLDLADRDDPSCGSSP